MKRLTKTLKILITIGCAVLFSYSALATVSIPTKRHYPVNTKIKPCDNFYEHVCSKISHSFKLPKDRAVYVFAFSDAYERLLNAKKRYLKKITKTKSSQLAPKAQTLKTIYTSCMNRPARIGEEKEIVTSVKKELKDIATRETFLKFLGEKILTPDFSFIAMGQIPNSKNPKKWDIYLLSPMQTLPERSYYEKKVLLKDYKRLVAQFFRTIKMDKPVTRANWVVNFEKQFTKTYPLPHELDKLIHSKTSIVKRDLLADYPQLALTHLLSNIPNFTHIRHLTPDNFKALNNMLATMPLEQLKSVYLFKRLHPLLDEAYPAYFNARHSFNRKHLGGPKIRPPRVERCAKYVAKHFEKELDAELLPELFPSFSDEKVVELVDGIKSEMIIRIENNTWLSKSARKAALKKVKRVKMKLVKPSHEKAWDFNPIAVYAPNKFNHNQHVLETELIKKNLRELSMQRERDIWKVGPLRVNAFYTPSDNSFTLPIGILTYPLYDQSRETYLNYAGIGMLIAHELGHAFDNMGSKYDHKGRRRPWMNEKDLKTFRARTEKLVKQFNDIGHNGELTLGENIADHAGLTFAFRAAFQNSTPTPKALQQFYIQYAKNWCGVINPKMKDLFLKVDPHATFTARVNEQVKLQPTFKDAFSCRNNDNMTLTHNHHVDLW